MTNDNTGKTTVIDSELAKWLDEDKANEVVAFIRDGLLTDEDTLSWLAINAKAASVRCAAAELVTDPTVLAELALHDESDGIREDAMCRITDQAVLGQVALHDTNYNIRIDAVKRVTDQSVLAELALHDIEPWVRKDAIQRLTDQSVLATVALWEYDKDTRAAAQARLTDEAALATLKRRRATHPDMEVDVFEQKFDADSGRAPREVHHTGPDSIYYTDSYLWDCNLAADIYCYYNGGNEYFTTEDVTVYRGADMDEELWRFESHGSIDSAAIDKRARYAAVSEDGWIYIVEAAPKEHRSYPGDDVVLSPAGWSALNQFDTSYDTDLAFDDDDRLHVHECDIGYVLDLNARRVWDDQYILYDLLDDPQKLADMALHCVNPELRFLSMQNCSDQALFAHILKTDKDWRVRRGAVFCVTDQAALKQAAAWDEDYRVRIAAIKIMQDMRFIENAAQYQPKPNVRAAAAGRITDRALLKKIKETDEASCVQKAASSRLWELYHV